MLFAAHPYERFGAACFVLQATVSEGSILNKCLLTEFSDVIRCEVVVAFVFQVRE
jgi:hypothetical protein